MWPKRASELWDIVRISEPNWHTPSSGCWEAPSDFGSLVAHNSSSNKNIAIIGTLDVDINASLMVDSAVAGKKFVDLSSPAKMPGKETANAKKNKKPKIKLEDTPPWRRTNFMTILTGRR
jgi:hypothetical protein